jgi:hypothetical protein
MKVPPVDFQTFTLEMKMKNFARLLSGALFGLALLVFGFGATPAAASSAGGGFCDETENYVCCCSTNPDGSIIGCSCMPKP